MWICNGQPNKRYFYIKNRIIINNNFYFINFNSLPQMKANIATNPIDFWIL